MPVTGLSFSVSPIETLLKNAHSQHAKKIGGPSRCALFRKYNNTKFRLHNWPYGMATVDHFKEEFKRYKKKSADLREVLDARNPEQAKNFKGTQSGRCILIKAHLFLKFRNSVQYSSIGQQ